jgi:L-aminopeptidase/D-esterase-like protein
MSITRWQPDGNSVCPPSAVQHGSRGGRVRRRARQARGPVARGARRGITVSVRPAHTRYDGDVVFACAAPSKDAAGEADLDLLGVLATEAVAAAVRGAVTRT